MNPITPSHIPASCQRALIHQSQSLLPSEILHAKTIYSALSRFSTASITSSASNRTLTPMSTYLTKTDPSTESSNAHDEVARVVWLCRNKKAATVELRRRAKEINRARANVEERTENLHMFTKHAKRHVYATAPRALHSPLSLKTLMRQLSPEAKRLLRLKEHSLEEFKQLEHEQRLASGEPALISMVQEKEDWFAAMQKTEEAIQHLHALHMTLPLVVETAQAPLDPKLAAFEKQYMDWDLEKQKKSYVGH